MGEVLLLGEVRTGFLALNRVATANAFDAFDRKVSQRLTLVRALRISKATGHTSVALANALMKLYAFQVVGARKRNAAALTNGGIESVFIDALPALPGEFDFA